MLESVALLDVSQPTAQLKEMQAQVDEYARSAVKELGAGAISTGSMRGAKFNKLVGNINSMVQDADAVSKVQIVRKLAEAALNREVRKDSPMSNARSASQQSSLFQQKADEADRKLNVRVNKSWKSFKPAEIARINALEKQRKGAEAQVADLKQKTLASLSKASKLEEKASQEHKELLQLKHLATASADEQQKMQKEQAERGTQLVQHLHTAGLQKKGLKADRVRTMRKLRLLTSKAMAASKEEKTAAKAEEATEIELQEAQRSQDKQLQPEVEQLTDAIEQRAKKQSRSAQVKSQELLDKRTAQAGATRAKLAAQESEIHLQLQQLTKRHHMKKTTWQHIKQEALNAAAKVRGLRKQVSSLGIETTMANRHLRALRRESKLFEAQACKLKPQSILCQKNAQLYVKSHAKQRLETLKQRRIALHAAKLHQDQLKDAIQKLRSVQTISRKAKQRALDESDPQK